jgi:putative heme iron utilization protein
MSNERSHMEVLRELLESQLLGVLGTHHDGEPYTSLVGFAATEDLKHLLFATGKTTRKRANLVADARASILVDNRTNRPADFTKASAATAVGVVEEVSEAEGSEFDRVFLAKHPHLEAFVHSPSCARLRLGVSVYMVVTHFQHVIELHID